MKLAALFRGATALAILISLCGCSPNIDPAEHSLTQSIEAWSNAVGLATNHVSVSDLQFERFGRGLYSFSCRLDGIQARRPAVESEDFIKRVRFKERRGRVLALTDEEWLQLGWLVDGQPQEWLVEGPSVHSKGFPASTNIHGFYIKMKSEPCALAILFHGDSAYLCAHGWRIHDKNLNPTRQP